MNTIDSTYNIYKLLPQTGKVAKWIEAKEKEAEKLFGAKMKLWFADLSRELAIDAVCKLVSDVLSVPVPFMFAETRETGPKEARHVTVYLCMKYIPEIQDSHIGAYLKKDRSTISWANIRIKEMLETKDAAITSKVNDCETELLKRINA